MNLIYFKMDIFLSDRFFLKDYINYVIKMDVNEI